ncbi:MAG: methyltransferase domain-containing protein [Betaproteobacteria bacterium]|nr:MAG: methyltransferase domain-containing protein [Betaproteobacteria bacterium]
MAEGTYASTLNMHYGRKGLGDRIIAALRQAGKDPDSITTDDLSPVAEFHIGGQAATLELAQSAGMGAGMRVLDIGSGLGGPARTLAQHYGCKVAGLDLTEEFCRVATMLTELCGMHERVSFMHGNALDIPFENASFDLVWTQQAGANIENKLRLYQEVNRVLAVGGRLVFQEVLRGPETPLHLPVPWAREGGLSFLQPPDAIRDLLARAGFREMIWHDVTAQYIDEYRKLAARTSDPGGPPPLGIHLILGPEAGEMRRNVVRNLEEQRIVLIQGVLKKS